MPTFTTIMLGIFVIVALRPAVADSSVIEEFQYSLANTDCNYVMADRAFGLKLMGRDFPMPSGYEFRGSDHFSGRDWIRFQTTSNHDPRSYVQENPEISTKEAIRNLMAKHAKVYYYEEVEGENLESDEFRWFEAIEWQGLSLLISKSTGGKSQTTAYQVVVRADGDNDRLWFSSTNIEQITKIIACATIDQQAHTISD